MTAAIGWALAAAAMVVGFFAYGWPGLVLALTVVSFWMLLQFSRALRVMRGAAQAPVGHIDSAVMLNARLQARMTLMKVIVLTRSLGQRVGEGQDPERWRWADPGGASVLVELRGGRVSGWTLSRPEDPPA